MNTRVKLSIGVAVVSAAGIAGTAALAVSQAPPKLTGYQEVPALSTPATGTFSFTYNTAPTTIDYTLTYSGFGTAVSQAHIHLGQAGVNGGVIAFLCGGGGKPACPANGTVSDTIVAANVVGPSGQGIAAGEIDELVAAMKAGVAYANVHSTAFGGGEIRAQIPRQTIN